LEITLDKPKILICAFDSEGFEDKNNISQMTAEKLQTEYPNALVKVVIFPVNYREIDEIFTREMETFNPDHVLAIGEQNTKMDISIPKEEWKLPDAQIKFEDKAINEYITISDYRRNKLFIHPEAPDILNSKNIIGFEENKQNKLKTVFSDETSGVHCNYLHYRSLKRMDELGKTGQVTFLHITDPVSALRPIEAPELLFESAKEFNNLKDRLEFSEEFLEALEKVTSDLNEMGWETCPEREKWNYLIDNEDLMKIFIEQGQTVVNDSELTVVMPKYESGALSEYEQSLYEKFSTQYAATINQYVQNAINSLSNQATTEPVIKN